MTQLYLKPIEGTHIFSNRITGECYRHNFSLDEKDNDQEQYVISLPLNTWSINPSFFIGLFLKSIDNLGETKFRDKYKFSCIESYLFENIEQGICDCIESLT